MTLFEGLESINIVKKNFLVCGCVLTSPPIAELQQVLRVDAPVYTAVYFMFVNHENKVQLLKRLDITGADEKKKRVQQALEFFAECKNLFDLMAEEDPSFRVGEIL